MNELQKVEYNGIIVLTTQQIAEAYEVKEIQISQNFKNNRQRFVEGKHYISLSGDDLRTFKNQLEKIEVVKSRTSHLYLWTQKGAFLHAKSLNTDKAWEVYDALVDNYFEKKKEEINVNQLSPELQMFNQIFQQVAKTELEQKKLAERADQQEKNMKTIIDTFKGMDSDVGTERWVNRCISKIAESDDFTYSFGNKYAAARNESYRRLTDRAGCRLDQKLRNAISRAEERGCTKELINQINKLSVIMQDKRLKEIYIGVIKEMMIAYRVEIA